MQASPSAAASVDPCQDVQLVCQHLILHGVHAQQPVGAVMEAHPGRLAGDLLQESLPLLAHETGVLHNQLPLHGALAAVFSLGWALHQNA